MNRKKRLIETYYDLYPLLLRTAVGKVRDLNSAYDVLQDLAVKIIELDDDFDIEDCSAYLFRSARNVAYDYLRKEKKYVPAEMDKLSSAESNDFVNASSRSESKQWLDSYLASFSPEMREAFARYILDGEKIDSIAADMGIKSATMRQRFRRMKQAIPNDILLFALIFNII
jgi:RNA polymerase sigma factor (sigma-70 family)